MVDGVKSPKIQSFEQLTVWQEAQDFAVGVYRVTRDFPKEELFGITSQLRRASSSISANIAEGFGRSSINDKLHFYTMAYGSLLESRNFLYLSNRLGYLDEPEFLALLSHSTSCQKLLNATKRSLKT